MEFEILFHDQHLVAVNKPHGWLTHNTSLARDAESSVLYELKHQLNKYLYTVHRLDRKTSGALVFALEKESQSAMSQLFREGQVNKSYLAIVRGFTDDSGTIDYPIKDLKGIEKDALTVYETLERFELPFNTSGHATSRYSLVLLKPETGRYHQLRMHMAHIFHPIIGDRPHGCNKQNRFFKKQFSMDIMLLHAARITFQHPVSRCEVLIEAAYSDTFDRMLSMMRTDNIL